jgi:adenosine kinase
MKIAVLGTLNKDLILPFEGSPIQSFGGIYYTLSTLSKLGGNDVSLFPISYIGTDVHQTVNALFQKLGNIDGSGLLPIEQKNHEVILEYISPERRNEKALFNFPTIVWKDIKKLLKADFFIVNAITGWDLSLDAFTKMRKKFYDKMYLDVHFLAMGTDNLGKRFPKRPDDIQKWLKGARFIQMNKKEFETINKDSTHEIAFFEENFRKDQVLIITLGGHGARVIFRKNGMVRNKHFPAHHLDELVDTTGCGDVFGASFVWQYLQSHKIYDSMNFAMKMAGANCLLKGTNEIDNLLQTMEKI